MNIKHLFFKNKTLKQTIFKNTFWMLLAEVVDKVVGFFLIIGMARHFGPENYGQLSFAFSFVLLFALLSDIGISTLVMREIAKDKSKSSQFIDNALLIKFILGVVTLILIFLFAQFLNKDPQVVHIVYFLGVYIVISSFTGFFYSVFNANEELQYQAFCRIVQLLILFGLVFFFILTKGSIVRIAYSYLISAVVEVLLSLLLVWRYFSRFFIKIDLKICKEILLESWPFALNTIAVSLYYYIGSLLLGLVRSQEEVGLYSVAFKSAYFATAVSSILYYVFYPSIARFFKESREKFDYISDKYAAINFGLVIPIGVGGTILAPVIINFLYKNSYGASVLPFQILIWAVVFSFLGSVYANFLTACNRQIDVLKITSVGAVLSIILNLILIIKFGVIGASVAILVTEIMLFYFCYRKSNKVINIKIIPNYFIVPLIFSGIMTVALLITEKIKIYNPIFLVLVGAAVYFLLYVPWFYYKNKKVIVSA